jgi:hypothetical protein
MRWNSSETWSTGAARLALANGIIVWSPDSPPVTFPASCKTSPGDSSTKGKGSSECLRG